MIFYISFILFSIMCVHTKRISTKSSLSLLTPCSVGLKFQADVNNTSGEDYTVELNPNVCCLEYNDDKCDIIVLIGSDIQEVPKGTTRSLQLIAPLLDPYERRGYCTAYLDYKSNNYRTTKRETLRVQFDTTLKHIKLDNVIPCRNVDEDPLNECNPVNCEVHYNGQKIYYSRRLRRCVDAPICTDATDIEVPKIVYNPTTNRCVKGTSVTEKDLNFLKSLNEKTRRAKNIMIIENVMTDYNSRAHKSSKVKKMQNYANDTNFVRFSFMRCWTTSYTSYILILVILIQCFLILAMVYCMSSSCGCGRKKRVIRKFFNYRQDASVTTPLIGTSNIDTETTDCQYFSESSYNIDKRIKCYKACQKERKANIKLSMSDDILSKCLNRRDWNRVPRSETIPEMTEVQSKLVEHKKSAETKVNFENDSPKKVKSMIKKIECSDRGLVNVVSEKEIKCHNYNVTAINATPHVNNDTNNGINVADIKNTASVGVLKAKTSEAEKGAQAYFSNDSIDDFLSERGLIYVGENPSKYSFTSMSTDARSTVSSRSSRTSKNNVVKNVLSLFSRKSKGPSSDPGLKKSKAELNLELIHMSHASVCSSSNDEYVKSIKRLKDSRSSL